MNMDKEKDSVGHEGISSSPADASSIQINQRRKKKQSGNLHLPFVFFTPFQEKTTHLCSGVCQLCHRPCLSLWSGRWYHVHVYVCVRAFPSCLWRGTARWFSQWRLSPTLGRCHRRPCSRCMCASETSARLFVWTACENNLLVARVMSWLSTFALLPISSIYLVSFFQISTPAHERAGSLTVECVCVCVCLRARMCSCCPSRIYCCSPSAAQSKWMTYQSCFLSLYCLRIIWKCFRLLNAPQCGMLWIIQRLSLRPPATVTIFPLFICFLCVYPHRLVGREKGKSREAARWLFAQTVSLNEKSHNFARPPVARTLFISAEYLTFLNFARSLWNCLCIIKSAVGFPSTFLLVLSWRSWFSFWYKLKRCTFIYCESTHVTPEIGESYSN